MAEPKRNVCKGCGKLLFIGSIGEGRITIKCTRCGDYSTFIGEPKSVKI